MEPKDFNGKDPYENEPINGLGCLMYFCIMVFAIVAVIAINALK